MLKRALIAASALFAVSQAPSSAQAQNPLSIWAGAGGSSTDGSIVFGKEAKQLGAQLSLPVIPLAVRADAIMFGSTFTTDAISYNVNAVLAIRLPVIQPYGVLGQGRYVVAPDTRVKGWNYGAGLRLGLGSLGVFGEVRKHEAIGRTLTVLGVTF
jgi:hypothetical protein